MISNCGHDENGKYSGGRAGDQTGGEWEIREWYNRPWNYVLRHPDAKVRTEIALLAERAAKNNLIGYDQNQRYTFWRQLKISNYDPAQITVSCETDCSAGVLAIVKSVGYRLDIDDLKSVNSDGYTGNMRQILKSAGFEVLTASKYLNSDAYLLTGDILLYEGHHTAINLTDGASVTSDIESGDSTTTEGVSFMRDLVRGDKGYGEIATLQRCLKSMGYYYGKIDRSFGGGTEEAVKAFQEDKGIHVNYPGTVGPKTWTVLLTQC